MALPNVQGKKKTALPNVQGKKKKYQKIWNQRTRF